MNRISSIVYSSLRNYRTGRGGKSSMRRASANPRLGEITMPESEIFSKQFGIIDYDDPDDIDAFESDFSNVGQVDEMHDREMQIKKKKLLTQIVKRKYFKCEDPPMLTWAEKEQIRLLHTQDPEEWSADRLSESFPATRDTVLKVLRSKWSPKNVKTVTKYDETAQKNWDLYRQGKLVVSAELRVRLEKFKDRKIKPMDVEEIAKKIIKQKPVFPKPKSTLFSSIIESNRNPDSIDDFEREKKVVKQIESGVSRMAKERRSRGESMTFDEFLKNRVANVQTCDETTPVDRVLVDEFKNRISENYKSESLLSESKSPAGISKEIEKMNLSTIQTKKEKTENSKDKSLIFESESPVGVSKEIEEKKLWTIQTKEEKTENSKDKNLIFESESPVGISKEFEEKKLWAIQMNEVETENSKDKSLILESESSVGIPKKFERFSAIERVKEKKDLIVEDKSNSIETGIIARHKKVESLDLDYPEYIKIPSKKYKPGVTYRVEDRYYDDDGQFLYRVPGLKS